jgi:hypothetical protein
MDHSAPPERCGKLHALLDVRPQRRQPHRRRAAAQSDPRHLWAWRQGGVTRDLTAEMEDRCDAARIGRRRIEEVVASRYAEHVAKLALIYAVG